MNHLPEIFPNIQWFISAYQNKELNLLSEFPNSLFKFTNKYTIAGPNQLQILTVPLIAHTKSDSFQKVQIDYTQKWIKEHKNAMQTAYGKSPFFEYYDYRIFDIFDQNIIELSEFNQKLLELLLKLIGLNDISIKTADYQENIEIFSQNNSQNFVPEYTQVFEDRFGFRPQVSILDLLFNQGPLCKEYFESFI